LTLLRARILQADISVRMDLWEQKPRQQIYEEEIMKCLSFLEIPFTRILRSGPEGGDYQSALTLLARKGLIYPCSCSRQKGLVSRTWGDSRFWVYGGFCRGNQPSQTLPPDFNQTQRLLDHRSEQTIEDVLTGKHILNRVTWGGDLVLWRRGNSPGYPLHSVLDDHTLGITEIHRGRDLLGPSAGQVFLYEALELPRPALAHFPLVVGVNGAKLSKRLESECPRLLGWTRERFFREWLTALGETPTTPPIQHWWEINPGLLDKIKDLPYIVWNPLP
jgi:glutamyl/glutaminyl-tRNA synthetase